MTNRALTSKRPKALIAGAGFVLIGAVIIIAAQLSSTPAPDGMVWIPSGEFWMGTDDGPMDERPCHRVRVDGFWMDRTEVTNSQFAEFVKATNYVTVSEQQPDPKKYPGAKPELLVPGSAIFAVPDGEIDLNGPPVWWKYVPGACWKHPEGPGSTIEGRENHPVVHIAWDDAAAYAKWAGKRLPTEAEFEYAARGGLDRKPFIWGDDHPGKNGKWQANIWQGRFPIENTCLDGFKTTAPVGSFPPNGFGLVDMSGNVWEWCQDWYDEGYYRRSPKVNPKGPEQGQRTLEGDEPSRVRRGGSFLCCDDYCRRYVPNARDKNPPDSSASHTGFRCVKDR
jgi:formylglycine-generating enzyme required for sulfatase activity